MFSDQRAAIAGSNWTCRWPRLEPKGCLIYLRQEGRGIGLVEKLKAANLKMGMDTIEANEALGHQADARSFDVAAEILRTLGMLEVRLLTNNPQKVKELEENGIRVETRARGDRSRQENKPTSLSKKRRWVTGFNSSAYMEMACMSSMHTMAPTSDGIAQYSKQDAHWGQGRRERARYNRCAGCTAYVGL